MRLMETLGVEVRVTGQLSLVDEPARLRLGDREAFALEQIRRQPGGILQTDLGALLHARSRKHEPHQRCDYCSFDGLQILKRLRAKKLVKRERKTGLWRLTRGHRRLVEYGPEAEAADHDPFPKGF